MGQFGYDFYFTIGEEVLTLPITPSSLRMNIGSKNKVVTLINDGDINILKSPALVEFEFEARFPMRDYPYSRKALNFEVYMNKFTALKTEKTPFVFSVVRTTPNGKGTWGTTRRVTLEDLEINEDADEGDDVLVSFNLKEYKEYGVRTIQATGSTPVTTSTSEQPRSTDNKATTPKNYTVKSGDTLWAIAKAHYGDGAKWTVIYEANKSIIDSTAEKYRGKGKGSSNGHWIYPNTPLIIPNMATANSTAQQLKNTEDNKNKTSTQSTYKVEINTTSQNARYGSISIVYQLNGVKRRADKSKNATALIIRADAGSEVTVYISLSPARGFTINGSSGLWTNVGNIYTLKQLISDSSLSINWT